MALFKRHRRQRREKSSPPPRRATLGVTAIGARGDGVSIDQGRAIFTPLTAPGDVAVIEARGERGRLIELIEESPHRAAPPCPHYGVCGGCGLQHVNADFYRNWKRDRVVDALAKAGLAGAPVAEIVATQAAARRRATFAVRKRRGVVTLGFNARHLSDIVAISGCVILHKDLRAALPRLKALAEAAPADAFDLAVTLCRNGLDIDIQGQMAEPRGRQLLALTDAADAAQCVRLSLNGEALITIEPPVVAFDGVLVTPPPGGFLQASREGEAALLALVKDAVGGARKVADLFCGCGAFSLPLAANATVLGVDNDARAVAALQDAAAAAQAKGEAINPVRAETRDLFERPLMADELNQFDAVVFDPPRAGAARQAEEIARSSAPRVIGVSCNPATFARDAAILSQGGYALSAVTPVDQFVYSPHVELVGVFTKE